MNPSRRVAATSSAHRRRERCAPRRFVKRNERGQTARHARVPVSERCFANDSSMRNCNARSGDDQTERASRYSRYTMIMWLM